MPLLMLLLWIDDVGRAKNISFVLMRNGRVHIEVRSTSLIQISLAPMFHVLDSDKDQVWSDHKFQRHS